MYNNSSTLGQVLGASTTAGTSAVLAYTGVPMIQSILFAVLGFIFCAIVYLHLKSIRSHSLSMEKS